MDEKMQCSENGCKSCCRVEFKTRPFEININRVKGLNKPYTRSGRVVGNLFHIIDSMVGIITFGHIGSNFGREWIIRELDKFFQYNENDMSKKFKLRHFKFDFYVIRKINKPFTRSERVFGNFLQIIDSVVGIITFGHFDSFLHHEWTSRELIKLGQYIEKMG